MSENIMNELQPNFRHVYWVFFLGLFKDEKNTNKWISLVNSG